MQSSPRIVWLVTYLSGSMLIYCIAASVRENLPGENMIANCIPRTDTTLTWPNTSSDTEYEASTSNVYVEYAAPTVPVDRPERTYRPFTPPLLRLPRSRSFHGRVKCRAARRIARKKRRSSLERR